MDCPLCGSLNLHRDYAPARSHVLILLGLGLMFAGRFLRPELARFPLELDKLVILGVAVGLFGLFDCVRHGNRYCGDCGYRFRARGKRQAGGGLPLRLQREASPSAAPAATAPERPGAKYIRGLSHAAEDGEKKEELDPNTPLEPILACLKFKDAKMRREAARTLRRLTGQDLGEDYEAWQRWYDENKEAYWAERRKSHGADDA